MKKYQLALFTSLAVVLMTVLTACGATKQGGSKQQLDLRADAPLDSIDLANSTGYGQSGNIFESFYRLGKDGKVTPGLADSTKVSKDGMTYTFHLRKANWSNGDPIKAQDFVYSWQRTLAPKTKSQYAYLFDGVKNAKAVNSGKMAGSALGIKAEGDHTVVVTLDKPMTYFKILMAYPLFAPQNKAFIDHAGKKYATKSQYMIYSGPFKAEGWNGTGNKWSFVKNNQYWDKNAVKLNRINYTVINTPATGLNLYQSNKLSMTMLANEQVKNYQNNAEYHLYPYSQTFYLRYNFKNSNKKVAAVTGNQNIRQAISLAIDREQLTKKVLGDGSKIPTGFVTSGLARDPKNGKDFADEQVVKDQVTHNEKLAKQKWEAGLKQIGRKNVTLTLLASNDQAINATVTQYLKGQLQKVLPGFTMNIRDVPGQIATQENQKGNFDFSLSSWGADFNDPISFLQIPLSDTAYNYGKYKNTDYDALLERAQNEDANDPDKRWGDLVAASKILTKDQGFTPLYQTNQPFLVKKNVHGIIHNTAGTQWNYKYAYIQ